MPTFDGPNLTITLDSGITEVDLQIDLYSDWKEWVQLSDNAKFPEAFKTSGGDPLTPGLTAAAYFFLQNTIGWRIRPPEEDITIFLDGNLAPQNTSLPMFAITIGNFNTQIINIQPITQSVSSLLTLQELTADDVHLIKQVTAGKAVVSPDDLTITIYEEDGTTVLATYSVSLDTRTRIKTS